MAIKQFRTRITGNGTVTIVGTSCAVRSIVISPQSVGTAWVLAIRDKDSPPQVLIPAFTMASPADGVPTITKFDDPVIMKVGIDIITSGTAAGEVDVWITVEKGADIPT